MPGDGLMQGLPVFQHLELHPAHRLFGLESSPHIFPDGDLPPIDRGKIRGVPA